MENKMSNFTNEVIDYILGNNESEPSQDVKQLAEEFKKEISKLVPEDVLIKIVNLYGGVDIVINDINIKLLIADIFKVEISLVNLKLQELYNKETKKRKIQAKYKELDNVINELNSLGEALDDIYNYTIYTCMEISHGRKPKTRNHNIIK